MAASQLTRRATTPTRKRHRAGAVHRKGATTAPPPVHARAMTRAGAVSVSEVQRSRMLNSAARAVARHGYSGLTVTRVAGDAGVSRRTFYELFDDREDCFLAIFDDALDRVGTRVQPAYHARKTTPWHERVRRALTKLLGFLDEQPTTASLLVVDALTAGPRVLERRTQVLNALSTITHRDGSRAAATAAAAAATTTDVTPLTGEGVIGAVFGLIHTRITQNRPTTSMLDLLNPLTAIVVLPYLGRAAAQRELKRPTPSPLPRSTAQPQAPQAAHTEHRPSTAPRTDRSTHPHHDITPPIARGDANPDPLAALPMRITYRTLRVLGALAEHPGASNRTIADAADIRDQGQISKLLARLQRAGLIVNARTNPDKGAPNSWKLTHDGRQVTDSITTHPTRHPATRNHHSDRSQPGKPQRRPRRRRQ